MRVRAYLNNIGKITCVAPQTWREAYPTEATAVEPNTVLTLGHSTENGELGFWLFTGTTIPANRAYIANPPSNVRGFTFSIDDDPTGIQTPKLVGPEKIYDLQGREIPAGNVRSHSLFIKNGRKYYAK